MVAATAQEYVRVSRLGTGGQFRCFEPASDPSVTAATAEEPMTASRPVDGTRSTFEPRHKTKSYRCRIGIGHAAIRRVSSDTWSTGGENGTCLAPLPSACPGQTPVLAKRRTSARSDLAVCQRSLESRGEHGYPTCTVSPAPSAAGYPDSGQETLRGQSNLKDFKQ